MIKLFQKPRAINTKKAIDMDKGFQNLSSYLLDVISTVELLEVQLKRLPGEIRVAKGFLRSQIIENENKT